MQRTAVDCADEEPTSNRARAIGKSRGLNARLMELIRFIFHPLLLAKQSGNPIKRIHHRRVRVLGVWIFPDNELLPPCASLVGGELLFWTDSIGLATANLPMPRKEYGGILLLDAWRVAEEPRILVPQQNIASEVLSGDGRFSRTSRTLARKSVVSRVLPMTELSKGFAAIPVPVIDARSSSCRVEASIR